LNAGIFSCFWTCIILHTHFLDSLIGFRIDSLGDNVKFTNNFTLSRRKVISLSKRFLFNYIKFAETMSIQNPLSLFPDYRINADIGKDWGSGVLTFRILIESCLTWSFQITNWSSPHSFFWQLDYPLSFWWSHWFSSIV
jgi:hypothetical protein